MIGRRSLLAAALGAPAALSASKSSGQAGIGSVSEPCAKSDIDPLWKDHSKLTRALERKLERKRYHSDPSHFPAHIATKKSWSPAFKEACFRKEWGDYSDLSSELNDAMYGDNDPISRGVALAKLAKRIGT